jgi:uncharacterized membrane protein YbjE (DUF340 family)
MKTIFIIVIIFVIGLGLGVLFYLNNLAVFVLSKTIELLVYILLSLITISMVNTVNSFKDLINHINISIKVVISTISGSIAGGLLAAVILNSDIRMYIAIALGMGFYTFTGSYLATINRYFAFLGFTVNMFREVATFIIYPLLSRKYPIEAITIGGATTMDTTLPVISKVTNNTIAMIAFIHGFILTLTIPVIMPVIVHLWI